MRYEVNTITGEVSEFPDAAPSVQDAVPIQDQINALEGAPNYMNRATREFQLAMMVYLAAGQGVDEPTLYATNIGYRKVKDLDSQIAELRAQL